MSHDEELHEVVRSLVEDFQTHTELPDSVYLLDNIPTKKLKNARQSHEIDIHTPVLMLVDRTVFGGAKDSTIITPYYISFKEMWEESYYYPWKVIRTVDVVEDQIVFYFEEGTFSDGDYIAFDFSQFVFGEEPEFLYTRQLAVLLKRIANAFVDKGEQLLKDQEENIKRALETGDWAPVVEGWKQVEDAGLFHEGWYSFRA